MAKQAHNLAQLQRDPASFRGNVLIPTAACARRVTFDAWQQADFAAIDPALRRVVGQSVDGGKQRAYLERPRGHSKTSDIALIVTWLLFASRRTLHGVAAAADKDQARLLRTAVRDLVKANPWLNELLEVQRDKVVNLHTDSELQILSADANSSYGLTPDFVVCDELTHWPARELWDSLFSSAAKKANCLLLVIANAGWGDTWQQVTRDAIAVDPDWYFSRLDGPCASWISPKLLAEQRRLLPDIAFARLWLNRWTTGSGDALAEADLAAAFSLITPTAAEEGWQYFAGLDLGLSRDASALAIVGRHVGYSIRREKPAKRLSDAQRILAELDGQTLEPEYEYEHVPGTGRLRLARLMVWEPQNGAKVSIDAIESAIIDVHRAYNLAALARDPWQSEFLGERLAKQGIPDEPIHFTGPHLQEMATATLDAFRERTIDLFTDSRLAADLRNLRVTEKSYGFRLESPRNVAGGTRHGDTATALQLALCLASRHGWGSSTRVHGELICYP